MFNITPTLRIYLDKIKRFEDRIPYMYLDTKRKVTVGLGHNVESHRDVLTLPFEVRRFTRKAVIGGDRGIPLPEPHVLDRTATKEEIQNDYDFLKKHQGLGGYPARNLADYTTLELPSHSIDGLFDKDLEDAISLARTTFTADRFDAFPEPCQAALIDIAFNCGSFDSFGTIRKALSGEGMYEKQTWRERWTAAAEHCGRGEDVTSERYHTVKAWFLEGASSDQREVS